MTFPRQRPRRLRRSETLRAMLRETTLSPNDFILPLFAMPGRGERHEVSSMPGVYQLSVDQIVVEAKSAAEVGVPSVILFGLPSTRTRSAARAGIPRDRSRAASARSKTHCHRWW